MSVELELMMCFSVVFNVFSATFTRLGDLFAGLLI